MGLFLTNRNYRKLFTASAITNLGDGVSALAFPWLATLITRDPALIAFVAFAGRLPWFLLSIPAGVITDRYSRQRLMVQADLFRLVLTLGVIALIYSLPSLPPPDSAGGYILALSGLAFLLGAGEVLRDNAAQTALPSVVGKGDLERANGQIWSIEQIMGAFVGPPLAGVLIALAVPAPFALDAITFGVSAWLIARMAFAPRRPAPKRSAWVAMREGISWIKAHPTVLRLAIMLGVMNALAMTSLTMLVLFSQEVLGLGAFGHGMLLTAGAAGGVLGGLLGPGIAARLGNTRSLHLALIVFPLVFVAIALSSNVWIVAAALFVEMFVGILWNVVTVSYRQRIIPDDLLGRVNSIYRFFGWGLSPIGALLGGWIVVLVEPELGRIIALRAPFILAGIGMAGLWVYGLFRLRL